MSEKTEETLFEIVIRQLDDSVGQSRENADTYGSLVGRINIMDLACDVPRPMESKGNGSADPNTVVYRLNNILQRLQNVNHKNNEIIDNLKKLV